MTNYSLLTVALLFGLAACAEQGSQVPPPSATMSSRSTDAIQSSEPRQPLAAELVKDFEVAVGDRVLFDYDKYTLRPDAQDTLRKQAVWLQKYPRFSLTIEGHADERGTREYNLALGERRAASVRDYLANLGVADSRLKVVSYGKERPIVPGHDEESWKQNRRAVSVPLSAPGL